MTPTATKLKTRDETFAERLRSARGSTSLQEVAWMIRKRIEDLHVDPATLSRYETGRTPEDATNPLVVWAISDALGADLEYLSPRAARVREALLNTVGGPGGSESANPQILEMAGYGLADVVELDFLSVRPREIAPAA